MRRICFSLLLGPTACGRKHKAGYIRQREHYVAADMDMWLSHSASYTWPRSSIGESSCLIRSRSQVRDLPGLPKE